MKKKKTNIYFPEKLLKDLKLEALKKNTSMTKLVEKIIEEYFVNKKKNVLK